jgi:hypothetical protein
MAARWSVSMRKLPIALLSACLLAGLVPAILSATALPAAAEATA